jgi:hypothetical protein
MLKHFPDIRHGLTSFPIKKGNRKDTDLGAIGAGEPYGSWPSSLVRQDQILGFSARGRGRRRGAPLGGDRSGARRRSGEAAMALWWCSQLPSPSEPVVSPSWLFFRIVPYSWKPEGFDPFRILGPMLEQRLGQCLQPNPFMGQSNPTRPFVYITHRRSIKVGPRVWGPFRPLGLHDPFPGLTTTGVQV